MDKMDRRIFKNQEVRMNRLIELKSKIKMGEYEVDIQKLADKMLIESFQKAHRGMKNR